MPDAVDYLLEGDPAIRWQVLRDLTDAPHHQVAAERARVTTEGWGARLLAEQAQDGTWDGGTYRPGWVDEQRPFFDAWTATHHSLELLREFGVDPSAPEVRRASDRVRSEVRWEEGGQPYFDGEIEPCINGGALANAAYFGHDGHRIVDTLVRGRLPDGGWNCWDTDGTSPSSFHSTICALEGLRAWEGTGRLTGAAHAARLAGEEYLLDRSLFRRRSTGDVVDARFTMPSFPTRWYFDVLRALEYFRLARPERDERCEEALELIRGKRLPNGLWNLELTHQGPTLFDLDGEFEGFPSRWLTLRALRVLRWWDGEDGPQSLRSSQAAPPASSTSTP